MYIVCFFVKQKTAYEMRISDWSSDVCSSDLKCGSATPTFGVYMAESNGNTILGGTVESNSHGGIHIATTCERNTWLNMHNELNGSGPDWKIEGNYNILIGCAGVATAASPATAANRSEDRRVGHGGASTCRARWWPGH